VVLSDQLWRQQFGGDPAIVGKTLPIKNRPYEVIGVLPPSFRGQTGTAELWLTVMAAEHAIGKGTATGGFSWWMGVIARLKPGVSIVQARAAMPALVKQVDETFMAKMAPGQEVYQLVALKDLKVHPEVSRSFVLLLAAVAFVLLIACANTANLLLGRAAARRKDFAVRRALGATRATIVRQVLIESLLVAGAAGIVGLVVAAWAVDFVTSATPANTSGFWAEYVRTFQYFTIRLQPRVLLFNFAVSATVGVLFGLAPAWQAARSELNDVLKQGAVPGGFVRRGVLSGRGILVLTEIALSLVLLGAAGLMIRSFARAANTDVGFHPEGVTTMTFAPSARKPAAFYYDLLSHLRALPGVESASLSSGAPMGGGGYISTIAVQDREPSLPPVRGLTNYVTPGFFETYRMQLREGRWIADEDTTGRPVAVVSRALAEAAWPGQSAIGKRIRTEKDFREVVGVAENAVYTTLEAEPARVLYVPVKQGPDPVLFGAPTAISIRTTVDPGATTRAVGGELRALDAMAPLFNVVTMDERISRVTARYRYSAALLGAMAVLALLMAAIGTYGVMAFAVAARTREIGIRVALGARPGDVMRLMLSGGVQLTVAGIAIGLAGTYAASRLLAAVLFGVSTHDPLTFAAIALLMGLVATVACYVPARRALRVDPVVALRTE
jgi:putative ABC transport system permease protein